MTDKVQKIREEVEMIVNRRLNLLNGDYFDLNKEADGFTNEIMDIIDSMQLEEIPPKFPLISQKKCMYTKDDFTDEDRKVLCDGCEEECKYAQKEEPVSDEIGNYNHTAVLESLGYQSKEEPVSEELEEASVEWFNSVKYKSDLSGTPISAFKAGAKWQKLKDMGITNNVKGVVTNILNSSDEPLDNYAAEVAFIMLPANLTENYHMTNRDRISDAVRLGAKWKEKQMMAKAVDGDITFDYYGDDDKIYGCIAHNSFCLEDFGLKDRDKVKVVVIKE